MPASENRNTVIATVEPGRVLEQAAEAGDLARPGLAGDGDDDGERAEVHRRVDEQVDDDGA